MHQLLIRFAVLYSFCLLVFIGFYLFISHRLLGFFEHQQDTAWVVWFSPVFILVTLLSLFALSCYRYYAYSQNGEKIADYYQARKVDLATAQDEDEKLAIEINQHIAEKLNIPVIPLYILAEEEGINAFSVGYDEQKIALICSKGSVKYLTPFEFETVITHEYSRILHKDFLINHYIDVMCYGFLFCYISGQALIVKAKTINQSIFGYIGQFLFSFLGVIFTIIGFPALLLTRVLKWSVFYHYRKKHDLQVAQQLDPQYFIYALARIDLHSYKSRLSHLHSEVIAHYCFANPARDEYAFPVIQSFKKRIVHLANHFAEQGRTLLTQVQKDAQPIYPYRRADVLDLSQFDYYPIYSKKMIIPYVTPVLQFTYPTSMRLDKHESTHYDNIQALSPHVRQNMHKSELIYHMMQTVTGCKEVVLSIMYIRQKKYTRIPLNYNVDLSHALLDALLLLDRRVHFYLILQCLQKIDHLSLTAKNHFIHQLYRYIQLSQYDFLDFLLIQRIYYYPRPKQGFPVVFKQVGLSILNIVQQFMNMTKLEKVHCIAIQNRICQQLNLGNVEFEQVSDVALLAQDLTLLSGLLIEERTCILNVIEQAVWYERLITQDELDAMCLLYWRLGLDSDRMQQRMLNHNRLVIV